MIGDPLCEAPTPALKIKVETLGDNYEKER
jgi:hypothetical protein